MAWNSLYAPTIKLSEGVDFFARRVAAFNRKAERLHLNATNRWADKLAIAHPSGNFSMDLRPEAEACFSYGGRFPESHDSKLKGDKNKAALLLQKIGVGCDQITF